MAQSSHKLSGRLPLLPTRLVAYLPRYRASLPFSRYGTKL